jgi:hypothetical protein
MKLQIAIALALAGSAALGANKCVLNGKVEYMDTPCPTEAKSSTVRTDRASSLDTSRSYRVDKMEGRKLDCDEAKETYRHNPSREQKAVVARHCGQPSAGDRAQLRAQQDAADARALKASREKLLRAQDKQAESLKALGRAANQP